LAIFVLFTSLVCFALVNIDDEGIDYFHPKKLRFETRALAN